jgi:hypothetical protein
MNFKKAATTVAEHVEEEHVVTPGWVEIRLGADNRPIAMHGMATAECRRREQAAKQHEHDFARQFARRVAFNRYLQQLSETKSPPPKASLDDSDEEGSVRSDDDNK